MSPFLRLIVPIASVAIPVAAIVAASYASAQPIPDLEEYPSQCRLIATQLIEAVEGGVLAKLQAVAIWERCLSRYGDNKGIKK